MLVVLMIQRRLEEHNRGENFSTSWRGPFELVYYEAYKSLEDARERELALNLEGILENIL